MLIGEIIQRIQSIYSKGVQSDDSRLSNKRIYNKIVTIRSKLISQQVKKGQKISQWNYQTIPCIRMEKALPYDCPCIPPVGVYWLKSKFPLPKPLTDLSSHLIQSVTNPDGDVGYDESTWETQKYSKSDKYTGKKPKHLIRKGYLMINSTKASEIITTTGLWEDPTEADSFPSACCDEGTVQDCTSMMEKEFPIDADMIDTLVEMASTELVEWMNKVKQDKINNSQEDEA